MDEFFARNRLSAYIDGELSDTEMAEVARAIEEQPEVRQAYRELLDAVELLREHGPVQAPSRFHADVMRRVEELPAARGWFSWLLRPLGRYPMQGLGVAVVAAAVLLLVFRGPDFGDLSSPEPAPVTVPDVEREAAAPVTSLFMTMSSWNLTSWAVTLCSPLSQSNWPLVKSTTGLCQYTSSRSL